MEKLVDLRGFWREGIRLFMRIFSNWKYSKWADYCYFSCHLAVFMTIDKHVRWCCSRMMFAARDESCVTELCKSAETGAKQCGERAYISD